MLKGQTVYLAEYAEEWMWDPFRFENGQVQNFDTDLFDRPVPVVQFEPVDDVLISPAECGDSPQATALTLAKERYTLAIPKSDSHVWRNGFVEFWGKRWKVVGPVTQGIDDLIPLRWNRKVTVELYES